jgi:hypothetical protein
MDLGQREVPEREPDAAAQLFFDALDLAERLARVRAFVVAVLDDQAPVASAPDVVDRLVNGLHYPLRPV